MHVHRELVLIGVEHCLQQKVWSVDNTNQWLTLHALLSCLLLRCLLHTACHQSYPREPPYRCLVKTGHQQRTHCRSLKPRSSPAPCPQLWAASARRWTS